MARSREENKNKKGQILYVEPAVCMCDCIYLTVSLSVSLYVSVCVSHESRRETIGGLKGAHGGGKREGEGK